MSLKVMDTSYAAVGTILRNSHVGVMLDMVLFAIKHDAPLSFVKQSGGVEVIVPEHVKLTTHGHLKVYGAESWSKKPTSYRIDRMRDANAVPPKGGWPDD